MKWSTVAVVSSLDNGFSNCAQSAGRAVDLGLWRGRVVVVVVVVAGVGDDDDSISNGFSNCAQSAGRAIDRGLWLGRFGHDDDGISDHWRVGVRISGLSVGDCRL